MNKRDYSFTSSDFNSDKVEEAIRYLAENLNFKEICKVFREISYDQICYYSEDSCGLIYKDKNKYTDKHIEQATYLQRKISTSVDLYEQLITSGNIFEESYLEERLGK